MCSSDLRASLLGSVAFGATAHAACPVLVLRAGLARTPDPDHPVVVGADGSPSAERALDVAADLADRTGADLVVLTAWTIPPVVETHAIAVEQYAPTLEDLARTTSAEAVARIWQRHPDLAVDARVVRSSPIRALREASRGAGRVVVGTHGHGRALSAVLGSVSQGVIHGAHCPVEVVRPHPADHPVEDVEAPAEDGQQP